MKIIFSGGGTLGPVTPLLSIAETYKKKYPDTQFVWVGTKEGPEKEIIEAAGIPFFVIGAGKWRRYFSWLNFLDILKIIIAFFQSILLLLQQKPNVLISAGGFISVPLHWAGALLGIPSWIHQQDIRKGLANKLMGPVARKITTALEISTKQFSKRKTEWIGNPSRNLHYTNEQKAREFFNIPAGCPVIFALGGGTGSSGVNTMIIEALGSWSKDWHIIHLTGKDRPGALAEHAAKTFHNYHVYKFFTNEMAAAYALADVVIARAGFGTLSELAALSKAAIIIPMPNTHQEENADFLAKHGGIIKLQEGSAGLKLAHIVTELVLHPKYREEMGKLLHNLLPQTAPEKVVEIIDRLIKRK